MVPSRAMTSPRPKKRSSKGSRKRSTPSYVGLKPASTRASVAARGSSKKSRTRCEVVLADALTARDLTFRTDAADLPGRPDIVFDRPRVAVFCDGDFWHGRDWRKRSRKLVNGQNAAYWRAKIKTNMARDARTSAALEEAGWRVVRLWETDILRDVATAAAAVSAALLRETADPSARDQTSPKRG